MRRAAFLIGIAAVLALHAAGAAEPDAAALAAGAKLNRVKCAKCHKLYDPAAYDDATWTVWMAKMKQKARLNDREYTALAAYFESQRVAAGKGLTQ